MHKIRNLFALTDEAKEYKNLLNIKITTRLHWKVRKKFSWEKSEEMKKKVCKLGRQKAAAKKKKGDRLHDVGI